MKRLLPIILLCAACDTSRPIRQVGDDGCPFLPPERFVWIDSTCHFDRCEAKIRQSECLFQLEITQCEAALQIRGEGLKNEDKTFAPNVLGSCAEVPAAPGAIGAVSCTKEQRSCRIDVYERTALDATVEIAHVLEDAPFRSDSASIEQLLDTDDALEGYLASMLVLDDRVIASSYAGNFSELDCHDFPSSLIHIVDLETLEERNARAPVCTTLLAADPMGRGFLAVFGGQSAFIGRFDREGTMTSSAPLPVPERNFPRFATHLSAAPDGVFVAISGRNRMQGAYVLELDPATLDVRATSPFLPTFVRSAVLFEQNTVVLADFIAGGVTGLTRPGLQPGTLRLLLEDRRLSDDVGFLAVTGAGSLYASTSGSQAAAFVIDQPFSTRESMRAAVFYEQIGVPWAAIVSPSDPSLMLVGVMKGQSFSFEASIARLNPAEKRFLPGSIPIGQGAVTQLAADRQGRVWAMLPWSGKLARISFR